MIVLDFIAFVIEKLLLIIGLVICAILLGLCYALRFVGIKKVFGRFIMENERVANENITAD